MPTSLIHAFDRLEAAGVAPETAQHMTDRELRRIYRFGAKSLKAFREEYPYSPPVLSTTPASEPIEATPAANGSQEAPVRHDSAPGLPRKGNYLSGLPLALDKLWRAGLTPEQAQAKPDKELRMIHFFGWGSLACFREKYPYQTAEQVAEPLAAPRGLGVAPTPDTAPANSYQETIRTIRAELLKLRAKREELEADSKALERVLRLLEADEEE